MRPIHLFDARKSQRARSACGDVHACEEDSAREDCVADHAAPNMCPRCLRAQDPAVHRYPALYGRSAS